jgi:hypothetical protein
MLLSNCGGCFNSLVLALLTCRASAHAFQGSYMPLCHSHCCIVLVALSINSQRLQFLTSPFRNLVRFDQCAKQQLGRPPTHALKASQLLLAEAVSPVSGTVPSCAIKPMKPRVLIAAVLGVAAAGDAESVQSHGNS